MLFTLIHGAYTSPWHWHRLVPLLEAGGATAVVPELPCDEPAAGLEEYVATVEAALDDASEEPVVVGSSLGAVTACVLATRRPVHALVTVCGVIPRPGRAVAEDAADMFQPAFATATRRNPDHSTTFLPEAACKLVFHDSDPELAREAASRLRRQSALPLSQPCPLGALPEVPRVGIVSREDRLLRPEWLDSAVRERLGVEPTVINCDHAPMLSRPAALADLLLEVSGDR